MKVSLMAVTIAVLLLCTACEEEMARKEHEVSIVANKAFDLAKDNSVDFSQYSLQSVRLMRDGRMGAIDDFASDEYISSIKKKLKGRKYWEACYMVTDDMVLGAKYCYYFEESNLIHLATYSVK